MSDPTSFLWTCCQAGAESALKLEVQAAWPDFRLAFSRPGLVTFKIPDGSSLPANFDLRSTFARTYGKSLGRCQGEQVAELVPQLWELVADLPVRQIHCWQRDELLPGERGFVPGVSELSQEIGKAIVDGRPGDQPPLPLNEIARPGDLVLDCLLSDPGVWMVGTHEAASIVSRWPGGVFPGELPEHAVSRAYLKMEESLAWSRLPISSGDCVVEIGSAPGGSCQSLLDHGLQVIGIDPAEMDEVVLAQEGMRHIRKRASEVRRRELKAAKWLTSDANVAPKFTLDAVEPIVTHESIHIRGMLLTLKLSDFKLAGELSTYLDRIRSWGFQHVKSRQLAQNRREICVLALRSRSMLREPRWKRKK